MTLASETKTAVAPKQANISEATLETLLGITALLVVALIGSWVWHWYIENVQHFSLKLENERLRRLVERYKGPYVPPRDEKGNKLVPPQAVLQAAKLLHMLQKLRREQGSHVVGEVLQHWLISWIESRSFTSIDALLPLMGTSWSYDVLWVSLKTTDNFRNVLPEYEAFAARAQKRFPELHENLLRLRKRCQLGDDKVPKENKDA